jgi:type VI secretion system protein ImpM
MPEPVILATPVASLAGATIGFCGKLPVRGDFVTSRLPRSFVDPWYDWLQHGLATSRKALGDEWEPAWNEAPIWRFALAAGICGPDTVLGLWMPSIDRIGRQFPITFAAIVQDGDRTELIGASGPFLTAAETAGLDGLAQDLEPEQIDRRIAPEAWDRTSDAAAPAELDLTGNAVWWSDGGPRVPAAVLATNALPNEAVFIGMLAASYTPGASEGSP